MKYLGLDVGDKTIGIAVSDSLMITAQGVETLERVGIRKDAGKVIELAQKLGCTGIVVGLPLMLSGQDSIQTQKVRDFSLMLENKIRSTGIAMDVILHDERFSTKIAEDVLIAADLSRKDRKKVIDKQAAVIILQSYMDAIKFQQKKSST